MNHRPATPESLLTVALQAASAAADEVMRGWHNRASIAVADKGMGDLVTTTDRSAEALAIAAIRTHRPDDAILAEESGVSAGGEHNEWLWVIDPLDGTVNFAHGLPHFAISVACLQNEKPVVGVIIDPVRGEIFRAVRNAGAFLNDRPIRVSRCNDLQQALLGTVFPKPRSAQMGAYVPGLIRGLTEAQGLRRSGSMVLDLAYVASGRLDGFWQTGMKAWDMAAGCLLIEEAGGIVMLDGDAHVSVLEASGCIAANPSLIERIRTLSSRDCTVQT